MTKDTVVSEDMTVYAVFKENAAQFTVTFNVDGTTQEAVVEEGSAIGDKLPANPTKDGYTFVGWNTKADGTGEAVTKDTVVNADMTVYAVFEKNEEPEKADKSNLTALIEYANSQKEQEEYQWVVDAVKEAFEKALADAEAVNADTAATQEQVDAAYELLLGKVHLLGFIGNPTDLKVTLDLAKNTSTEGKTEESVAVLNTAIAKAEKLLASGNVLQEELDAMVAELKAAIEGLKDEVVVEVDKAKLLEMIKKAEGYDLTKYTPVTVEGLKAALAGAKTVYDNPKATQKEVDSAYTSLQQAIFALRLIPNKDALEDLLKETEKLDFSLYTAESAEAVQKAYDKALAVFNDENADQAAVDKAAKELKVAKDNLKLKDNSNFKSWIIKILINECNKIYKKKSKNTKLFKKITIEKPVNSIDNSINNVNSRLDFELLINQLSYEEKLIATLYYNNGYSCSEISNILNMNVNTVKSKITRAKEKVKKYYEGGVLYE